MGENPQAVCSEGRAEYLEERRADDNKEEEGNNNGADAKTFLLAVVWDIAALGDVLVELLVAAGDCAGRAHGSVVVINKKEKVDGLKVPRTKKRKRQKS